MARRTNELFIGSENLTCEGRNIKHPALIRLYATINTHKIAQTPLSLIGLDLETNHLTGELRLLGFWQENKYTYYMKDFLSVIYSHFQYALFHGKSIAYWNRLDPFVIFKQFLYYLSDSERDRACSHFGKIGGEWDKKAKKWIVWPVCQVSIGGKIFGIMNVIRSSVQFFIQRPNCEPMTIWAYDIAQLYEYHLEREALGEWNEELQKYEHTRLPYYTKLGEEYHKIDWDRFDNDPEFRKNVLYSNELDAHAVFDLGMMVQEEFKTAFGYYPASLVSQGSLARSAIVATIQNKYASTDADPKTIQLQLADDLKSIGFINYYDEWATKYGGDFLKDFYALTTECYSGGRIEAYRFGYAPTAYLADIASAYPAVIRTLYDLRGCKITTGHDAPPHIANSYCFIRGVVNIPVDCDYHPITVKHPVNRETNICATGIYRASYTIEERDYLLESGATFSDETWYNVETTGELSPLAYAVQQFLDLRAILKAKGDTAQYRAKIAANSVYGILYEATDTYLEQVETREIVVERIHHANPYRATLKQYLKRINLDGLDSELKYIYGDDWTKIKKLWHGGMIPPDVVAMELSHDGIFIEDTHPANILMKIHEMYRLPDTIKKTESVSTSDVYRAGYRGGEFFNPIYATIITSRTRIMLARASREIERRGGRVILNMTDSVLWTGDFAMLPAEMWKEKKTVGYFEKPSEIHDVVCLGSGRYSYTSEDGDMTAKRRGLAIEEIHNPDGVAINPLDWRTALDKARRDKSTIIEIPVKILVSVGMMLGNSDYNWKDLGLIVDDFRKVDLVVGHTKRIFPDDIKNPEKLSRSLIDTRSLIYSPNVNGEIPDQTLSELRNLMSGKIVETAKQKRNKSVKKASMNYRKKNGAKTNDNQKTLYSQLRTYGYSREDAQKMRKLSADKIAEILVKDGKIK